MASINLYGEFAITVSVPVIGLLLILLCHCGRLWWARRSMANATDAAEKDTEQGQASGSDDDEQYALTTSKLRNWAVWLAIGWLFLVYTILCRTTFRSFACQEIDEGESFRQVSRTTRCQSTVVWDFLSAWLDDRLVWTQTDYTVDCSSSSYQACKLAAYIFILIYPVGVPACFGVLLYKNSAVLGSQAGGGQNAGKWWYGDSETFHFLVNGYRQDTFWCATSSPAHPIGCDIQTCPRYQV